MPAPSRDPPPGHARPPRPQDPVLGSATRLRHRALDRGGHRRRAAHRRRVALPCPLPHGAPRLDRRRVGQVRDRTAHQDLLVDRQRAARSCAPSRRSGSISRAAVAKLMGTDVIPDRASARPATPSSRLAGLDRREIADELAAHLELQTRRYIDAGMSEDDAARRGPRAFRRLDRVRDECHDIRTDMETDMQRAELRQELRMDAGSRCGRCAEVRSSRRRVAHDRARDRREHGDLQRARRGTAARAAVSLRRSRRWSSGTATRSRAVAITAVAAPEYFDLKARTSRATTPSRRSRAQAVGARRRRRRAGASHGVRRHAEHVRPARRRAALGRAFRRRRRNARRAARDRAQPCALDASLRRRSGVDRAHGQRRGIRRERSSASCRPTFAFPTRHSTSCASRPTSGFRRRGRRRAATPRQSDPRRRRATRAGATTGAGARRPRRGVRAIGASQFPIATPPSASKSWSLDRDSGSRPDGRLGAHRVAS